MNAFWHDPHSFDLGQPDQAPEPPITDRELDAIRVDRKRKLREDMCEADYWLRVYGITSWIDSEMMQREAAIALSLLAANEPGAARLCLDRMVELIQEMSDE